MENAKMFLGKEIVSVVLGSDDALHFVFADGSKMKLWDDGWSCCEHRYMVLDDDVSFCSGAVLLNVEVRNVDDIEEENGECHEVQFLEVMTNRGCFTVATHNEHSGYYGGFDIRVEAE